MRVYRRRAVHDRLSVSHGTDLLDLLAVPRDALCGRTALVTGAARGLGAATASLLADRGAKIAVVDVLDAGTDIVAAITAGHGEARFFRCDVADVAQWNATIDAVEAGLGPVDIFVHSAVHVAIAECAEMSLEDFERAHAVNARAPFIALRKLLPGMKARGFGVAVNFAVLERGPSGSALNSSKAAARTTFYTAARELDPANGVSLFSFLPGVVDTPGLRENVLPSAARMMGVTEDEALARIAHNPGYDGLLPAPHAAAALVYLVHHAREYHGHVADPFEPLARHGLIPSRPEQKSASDDWVRTFEEVYAHNRDLEERIRLRTEQLAEAHEQSERLLQKILPKPIAERLKLQAAIIADAFADASVVFSDLVGFTPLSMKLPPSALVELLDEIFSAFDDIALRLGLEKIKTIGDCYMLVGGVPEPSADHLENAARAALAFAQVVEDAGRRRGVQLACRTGLHVGPVTAGVIGRNKFLYDLWGDTVNTASRMESHGAPGRVHCTAAVRERLGTRFVFEDRGSIELKGKGMMHAFFLNGEN